MRLAGELEVFLIAGRTFDNCGQGLGKVLQTFVADMFEPGGSCLGNGNQPIGADQPIKEGFDAEGN